MPGEHFSVRAKFSDEGPGPDENTMKAHLTVHCWLGTRARWLVLALSTTENGTSRVRIKRCPFPC